MNPNLKPVPSDMHIKGNYKQICKYLNNGISFFVKIKNQSKMSKLEKKSYGTSKLRRKSHFHQNGRR